MKNLAYLVEHIDLILVSPSGHHHQKNADHHKYHGHRVNAIDPGKERRRIYSHRCHPPSCLETAEHPWV
jgi:hypothetical protein